MSDASKFGQIVNLETGEVVVEMFGPPQAAADLSACLENGFPTTADIQKIVAEISNAEADKSECVKRLREFGIEVT